MTNTLSLISDIKLHWCHHGSCHILRTRMTTATHQACSCLRIFALAIPSARSALFPDVYLACFLTNFQYLCYVLNKAFWQTPPLVHRALFLYPSDSNGHTKHCYLLLILFIICLSSPAPLNCKLHEGLQKSAWYIFAGWMNNEWISNWYRGLKEDSREKHMGSDTEA